MLYSVTTESTYRMEKKKELELSQQDVELLNSKLGMRRMFTQKKLNVERALKYSRYENYLAELHTIKRANRNRRKARKEKDLSEENASTALRQLMKQKRDEMELQLSFYEDLSDVLSAKQILHIDYRERKFYEKVVEKLRKGRKKEDG